MESDERDDVPLASLLNKGLFKNVGLAIVSCHALSVHSNSSFSQNVFVPTLC